MHYWYGTHVELDGGPTSGWWVVVLKERNKDFITFYFRPIKPGSNQLQGIRWVRFKPQALVHHCHSPVQGRISQLGGISLSRGHCPKHYTPGYGSPFIPVPGTFLTGHTAGFSYKQLNLCFKNPSTFFVYT